MCCCQREGKVAKARGPGGVLLNLQAYGPSQDTVAMPVKGETDRQEALGVAG